MKRSIVLIGLIIFGSVQQVRAQEELAFEEENAVQVVEAQVESSDAEGIISIDFKDAELQQVLRVISLKSGVDIVAGPDVTGLVTIKLTNVHWEEALDIILRTYGYTYERNNSIVRVMTISALEQEALTTEVFPLDYADAETVPEIIADMLSDRGRVRSPAAERGDVHRVAREALEARDEDDLVGGERLDDAHGRDLADLRLRVDGVGDDPRLRAGERHRFVPEVVDGHCDQRAGDSLARGEQHVELPGLGCGETPRASSSSESVVWPIADTVPTTRAPRSCASTSRCATWRILSGSATDEPPNFMTTVCGAGSGSALTSWAGRGP